MIRPDQPCVRNDTKFYELLLYKGFSSIAMYWEVLKARKDAKLVSPDNSTMQEISNLLHWIQYIHCGVEVFLEIGQ